MRACLATWVNDGWMITAFVFGALGGGAFLYFTGTGMQATPMVILVVTGVFFQLFGLTQHSHLPISFGRLNYILLATVLHQLQHSAELRHRDKNYGGQLSVFDWIFGTIYVPQQRESYRWGLNDEELGENNPHVRLRDFYFEPASHAWRLLTRRGARWLPPLSAAGRVAGICARRRNSQPA